MGNQNFAVIALVISLCLVMFGLLPTRAQNLERNFVIRGIKAKLIIIGACVAFLATIALIAG